MQMHSRIDLSHLPAARAKARPGAPPGAHGRPLPAVVVGATWTDHQMAIRAELVVCTGDDSHPWALLEHDLRIRHSRTAARIRRALEVAEDEPLRPEGVLGAQCEAVLGAAADGGARVRALRLLFAGSPTPPHIALGLEPGERGVYDGVIDDIEIEGSTLVVRLALDAPGDDLGAEPVCLVRRMLRTRGARVAGHELMAETGGDWAFDPRALVGERVRATCWTDSYGAAYGVSVVVGSIEAAD